MYNQTSGVKIGLINKLKNMENHNRPKVGVSVIIYKDNKILMLKKIGAHGSGTWSFPGGHLEFGEEIEDAVRREVIEETGVEIKNIQQVTFTNDIFSQEDKHYITIFVKAEIDAGEPEIKEPDKAVEMGWFEWNKMPEPIFLPIINLKKIYEFN